MSERAEEILVEREIEIGASPERVWEFLVDPAKAVRWMGVAADLEARPGGRYRVEVQPGHVASGEFVVVEPPARLVYTWGWEHYLGRLALVAAGGDAGRDPWIDA